MMSALFLVFSRRRTTISSKKVKKLLSLSATKESKYSKI
jgi:hypothetical protein